ncbi:cobalamin B12-binding domain-containing protein [Parasulfitobacter algicola]|uniref:B12-binding domain-containing protein n=1 Tax=Parasulfitobacter algicola TaxID=2614809 RepID=A0ABX2IKS5_9RHOB|nr:cobalamin B12-binding domain-containing protein [Sulfitobacter algicola]NSX53464.1 hypothetical protein [Sulfitobacter algicola]
MSNTTSQAVQYDDQTGFDNVDALASRVISELARRHSNDRTYPIDVFVQKLCHVAQLGDAAATDRLFEDINASGITPEEIVDCYIPQSARFLGDQWLNDRLGFADVTIGCARLQKMLRTVPEQYDSKKYPTVRHFNALMIVPQDDDHTLGAMVATDQLRRMGGSVHLSLGQSHSEILAASECGNFDVIMISASRNDRLELILKLTDILRDSSVHLPPIVLGGTIINNARNLNSLTGVDHVTNDLHEALRLCGLKIQNQNVVFGVTWS